MGEAQGLALIQFSAQHANSTGGAAAVSATEGKRLSSRFKSFEHVTAFFDFGLKHRAVLPVMDSDRVAHAHGWGRS
jgi:hypothetical protein